MQAVNSASNMPVVSTQTTTETNEPKKLTYAEMAKRVYVPKPVVQPPITPTPAARVKGTMTPWQIVEQSVKAQERLAREPATAPVPYTGPKLSPWELLQRSLKAQGDI